MALSIDDLRSFILVGTERSVTRAATQLGVSQQSVSERIRRLERRIGAPLFDRLPFGMRLSVAGYRFLPYATQCVDLIDQALDVVGDDDFVRIEVQRSVATAVMPSLGTMAETAQAKVSLTDDTDTNAVVSSLAAGVIDVAIGAFAGLPSPTSSDGRRARLARDRDRLGPHAPSRAKEGSGPEAQAAAGNGGDGTNGGPAADGPADNEAGAEAEPGPLEVVAESLFSDPVVWAAPPDHPLAQRGLPIALPELIAALPAGANVTGPTGTPVVAPGSTDLQLAARSILANDLAAGRLVELPLDQPSWVVPVSIAYRAVEQDRPAISAIRRALLEGHSRTLAHHNGSHSPSGGGSPGS